MYMYSGKYNYDSILQRLMSLFLARASNNTGMTFIPVQDKNFISHLHKPFYGGTSFIKW